MNPEKKDPKKELTVKDLLSAISETEYPQYILEALSRIQRWMQDTLNAPADQGMDPVTAMFEDNGEVTSKGSSSVWRAWSNTSTSFPTRAVPRGAPTWSSSA